MKTTFKTLGAAMAMSALLFSCSKKNDAVPTANAASNWMVSDTSYKGTTTVFTNNELLCVDGNATGQPDIGIQFAARPVANGNYSVVDGIDGTIGASQCAIMTSNSSGGNLLYSYTGGTVTVTISNGKITAAYTNVGMGAETGFNPNSGFTFAAAGTSTGTLVEQ